MPTAHEADTHLEMSNSSLIQRDAAGKPSKFWLSNLAADEDIGRLIDLEKLRWRIERDYQEMKGELGLVVSSSVQLTGYSASTTNSLRDVINWN